MDDSIYTPGAGTLPQVLAGRDGVLHDLSLALHEVATVGRARASAVILVGPRGVGKTVTLTTHGVMAAAARFEVVNLQAVAGRSGPVASLLQRASSRAAAQAGPWTRAKRAFDRLTSVSVGVAGVSVGISLALLAATLHRLNVDHPGASVVAGIGLPHTPEVLRAAGVTHPDRLFLVEQLPVTPTDDEAPYATIEPARRVGVT